LLDLGAIMRYIIFSLLYSLLIFAKSATCNELGLIRIGYIEFPPLYITTAQGRAQGDLVELLDKVVTNAGYNYTTTQLQPIQLKE